MIVERTFGNNQTH